MDLKGKKVLIIARETSDIEFREKEDMELVKSAMAEPLAMATQKIKQPNPKTFFGKGKVDYFVNLASELRADLVVVSEELSPSQLSNLKDAFDIPLIDRNMLILDLFSDRATSSLGKLQVELATLQYLYPRLAGARQNMDRQFGVVGMRGKGEQKLELDRRSLRKSIDQYKDRIAKSKSVEDTKKQNRLSSDIPIVSFIGYSNTGKSTLLNRILELTGRDDSTKVYADDRLFATLDTHARNIKLRHGGEIILTDTVGLISNLPHQLVEAFSSTLDEIKDADLLVNVIDASNPYIDVELETTESLLKDMGLGDKQILKVYNKVDLTANDKIDSEKALIISAFNDEDVIRMLDKIEEILFGKVEIVEKFFSFRDSDKLSIFLSKHNIISKEFTEQGTKVTAEVYGGPYVKTL